jgi:hypothetical protein
MKFTSLYIIIYIFLTFISTITPTPQTKWCWTKPSHNTPSSSSSLNWGYCQPTQTFPPYSITLTTSSLPHSGTTSSLYIQLYGQHGKTLPKQIPTNSIIETGSTINFILPSDKHIGIITKVILKLEGYNSYQCSKLTIQQNEITINFDCLHKIEPCLHTVQLFKGASSMQCELELIPEGDIPYEITIKSGKCENKERNAMILFRIYGKEGNSNVMIFKEGLYGNGESHTEVVNYNEVGDVNGFEIEINDKGMFCFNYVIIKNTITNDIKEFDMSSNEVTLIYPGNSKYIYGSSNKRVSNKKDNDGSGNKWENMFDIANEIDEMNNDDDDDNESDDDDEYDDNNNEIDISLLLNEDDDINNTSSSNSNSDNNINKKTNFGFLYKNTNSNTHSININDPNGGLLSQLDKSRIIHLTCEQTLTNPSPTHKIFGPEYINGKGNYMSFLAQCPSDCHKHPNIVFGTGIHPSNSPICLSAMIDNAISYYGGIISISVFPGFSNYPSYNDNTKQYKQFPFIEVESSQTQSDKSYTVAKVDNVDLVEKDIRILNHNGELSNEGRIELRLNGVWGSICDNGNNNESALRLCKDLGYKNGNWLNTNNDINNNNNNNIDNLCKDYNGNDYCSAEGSRTFFTKIQCSLNDISINSCLKDYASNKDCPKSKDALISCNNINTESNDIIPNGIIRLDDIEIENEYIYGRVEMSKNNQYLPICNIGISSNSGNVICKQMGYENGELLLSNENEYSKYKLDNTDTRGFSAVNIHCNGNESTINNCSARFSSIICKHSNDLIIKCKGKGDYTGKSQYNTNSEDIPAPGLGKLGLVRIKVTCATTLDDVRFSGDIGSVFIIQCPSKCLNVNANVIGTGLYRTDSSICKAGIHSGVLSNKKGGLIVISKLHPINVFHGSNRNGIASSSSKIALSYTFSVFQMNTGWKGMWKLIINNNGSNYISNILMNTKRLFSFIESDYVSAGYKYPPPLFKYISNNNVIKGGVDVSYKTNEYKQIYGLKAFTFIACVTLDTLSYEKQFLFSSNACGGFNVYIESNYIVIGDPCNTKQRLQTDLVIGDKDKTIIYVSYVSGEMKVVLFPQSYMSPIIKEYEKVDVSLDLGEYVSIGKSTHSLMGVTHAIEGVVHFVGVFEQVVQFDKVRLFIKDIDDMKYTTTKYSDSGDDVQYYLTKDGKECISECMDLPIPGNKGAPLPPKEGNNEKMLKIGNKLNKKQFIMK